MITSSEPSFSNHEIDSVTHPHEKYLKKCIDSLVMKLQIVTKLRLCKLKLLFLALCLLSTTIIVFVSFGPQLFHTKVGQVTRNFSQTIFRNTTPATTVKKQEIVCKPNTTASTTNYVLNMTTPEWIELMQKYIPINPTQHKWTVIKVNQTQNGWNDSNTEKNHNTTSIQNGSEPLLVLVDKSLAFWSPVDCDPVVSTAIIIPYRNREEHLRVLLHNLPPFLIRQKVRFTIFIVEQVASTRFNRALLMNIGFRESSRVSHFDCFIFHDVDLLPEDPRVPYACGPQPMHLSAAIDKHNYRLPYATISGGVLALSREQFKTVGGYSNMFFGWGGEDDDIYNRIVQNKYRLTRPKFVRYKMIRHERDKLNEINKVNVQVLRAASKKTFSNDTYLHSKYHLLTAEPRYNGLVYWIEVDIPEKQIESQLQKRLSERGSSSKTKKAAKN